MVSAGTGSAMTKVLALGSVLRWSAAFCASAIIAAFRPAHADPRAVVELFTSQGCSACPPADKVLGELAKDPDVVALSMPIDYWDYLGWKDTLADSRFSARQRAYSKVLGRRAVYTPQAIVNGSRQLIGSDRSAIETAIRETRKNATVPVTLTLSTREIKVSVAAGDAPTADAHGEVWLCSISSAVPISIGHGENRGQEITYHNVVRNLLKVGDWNGTPESWTVPIENVMREGVDGAVVFVQEGRSDRPGPMFGAAYTALGSAAYSSLH